jgi:uncharacterized protein DUF547
MREWQGKLTRIRKPESLSMKTTRRLAFFLFAVLAISGLAIAGPAKVTFPAGAKHDAWDALLKKYANEQGLVAYGQWKQNQADLKALDEYLAQFAPKPAKPAEGNDLAASAINAYNAFAIRWIIQNYPTESIQELSNSFAAKRNEIGGEKVALDDIEHGTLRPLLGWRTHATIVCCARSCPPLRRSAYTAATVDEQIDVAYRAWLARDDLNKFLPGEKKVQISSIFKWFKEDFDKAGGVQKILGKYGPSAQRDFLAGGGYKIEYLPYNWGLNDQGGKGKGYSRSDLIKGKIFGIFK